jgi:predicted esterase
MTSENVHQQQPVLSIGEELQTAKAALILMHGRGANAEDMLGLAEMLLLPGLACLAPQAAGSAWYPYPFTRPVEDNEPYLGYALEVIGGLVARAEAAGIPRERIALLGFSQGACLALEYAARHPARFGGVFGLSGGLIGAEDGPRTTTGSLQGTPVLVASSDPDPYIPVARVRSAAETLRALGGVVDLQIYPGLGHTVNQDELERITCVLRDLLPTG